MNTLRTGVPIAALIALFLGTGTLPGGAGGRVIAPLLALAMALFAYGNADERVPRVHGASGGSRRPSPTPSVGPRRARHRGPRA